MLALAVFALEGLDLGATALDRKLEVTGALALSRSFRMWMIVLTLRRGRPSLSWSAGFNVPNNEEKDT